MEFRRTKQPKKHPLRRELELLVVAYNSCLREAVKGMNIIILLRNAHPLYRSDFAYELRDVGLITKEQSTEFVKRTR